MVRRTTVGRMTANFGRGGGRAPREAALVSVVHYPIRLSVRLDLAHQGVMIRSWGFHIIEGDIYQIMNGYRRHYQYRPSIRWCSRVSRGRLLTSGMVHFHPPRGSPYFPPSPSLFPGANGYHPTPSPSHSFCLNPGQAWLIRDALLP